MSNDIEIWKPIPGYEGLYEASSWGRIRSLDRTVTVTTKHGITYTVKKKGVCGYGNKGRYMHRGIYRNGKRHSYTNVHRLIMLTFEGPPPIDEETGRPLDVCHKDNNKHNNRISNLMYGTHGDNMLHKDASSKYPYVGWMKERSKWRALYRGIFLGYFEVEEDAHQAVVKHFEKIGNKKPCHTRNVAGLVC